MFKWLTSLLVEDGTVEADAHITTGGTSSDFVKGDGSLDDNTYALDSDVVHKTGDEIIDGAKRFLQGIRSDKGTYSAKGLYTYHNPYQQYLSGTDHNFIKVKLPPFSIQGRANMASLEMKLHGYDSFANYVPIDLMVSFRSRSGTINTALSAVTNSEQISNLDLAILGDDLFLFIEFSPALRYARVFIDKWSSVDNILNGDFEITSENSVDLSTYDTTIPVPLTYLASRDWVDSELGNYLKNTTDTLTGELTITGSGHSSSLALERTGGTNDSFWKIGFWGTNLNFHPTTGSFNNASTLQLDTNMVGVNKLPTTALDVAGVITSTGGNSTQWNEAYNHDLQSITNNGNSTTKGIIVDSEAGSTSRLLLKNTSSNLIEFNNGSTRTDYLGRIESSSPGLRFQNEIAGTTLLLTDIGGLTFNSKNVALEPWVDNEIATRVEDYGIGGEGTPLYPLIGDMPTQYNGTATLEATGHELNFKYPTIFSSRYNTNLGGQIWISREIPNARLAFRTGIGSNGWSSLMEVWHNGNFDPTDYATENWVNAQNYLTSETDPIFTASPAGGISNTDITTWNEKGVQLTADQPTANIHLRDSSGAIISTLNVGFLNNEGTTISFNSTTDEIELKNDDGDILSSFPASALMTGVGFGLNLTGSTLDLVDSANNVIDSVTLTISNIQGLQTALDGKALKNTTISAGTGLTGGGTLAADRTISLSSSTQSDIANGVTAFNWGDHSQAGYALDSGVIHTNSTAETKLGKLTIDNDFEVSGISNQSGIYDIGTDSIRVLNPNGTVHQEKTSSITGAIKIILPKLGSNTMQRFRVDVYNYNTNSSFSVMLGGYNYSNNWTQTFAQVLNGENKDYTIRFGEDGVNDCVWIGELNSNWRYPIVSVTDFIGGYSNANKSWAENWDITFVTTFDNVGATHNNNYLYADWNKLKDKPTDLLHTADLNGYATETYVDNNVFSGNYNDLSNTPTIPTNNNQLTNGAGYITSSALNGYATENFVEDNFAGAFANAVTSNSGSTLDLDTASGNFLTYALSASQNQPSASGTAGGGIINIAQSSVGNFQMFIARDDEGNFQFRNNIGNWFKVATESWVNNQNFLISSDLNGYATQSWVSSNYKQDFSENTAFNKNFGTTSGTVAEGDHRHPASAITSGTFPYSRLPISAAQVSNWNNAHTHSNIASGNPHGVSYSNILGTQPTPTLQEVLSNGSVLNTNNTVVNNDVLNINNNGSTTGYDTLFQIANYEATNTSLLSMEVKEGTTSISSVYVAGSQSGSNVTLLSGGGDGVAIRSSSGMSWYNAYLLGDLLTNERTFQFPNASGTLALTSDITSVTGNLGLEDVINNNNVLTSDQVIDLDDNSLRFNKLGDSNADLVFDIGSADPDTITQAAAFGSSGFTRFTVSRGIELSAIEKVTVQSDSHSGGGVAELDTTELSTNRTFQFPNKSGTLALVEDLDSGWQDVTLNAINTSSGNIQCKTIGNTLIIRGDFQTDASMISNTIATLPSGYEPDIRRLGMTTDLNNSYEIKTVMIEPDGRIALLNPNNSGIYVIDVEITQNID